VSDLRIVVTSDTHLGPRRRKPLPAALLAACDGADAILHAGDLVTADVLDTLAAYAPLHAVAGNCDPWDLAERLAETRSLELGGVPIGITHIPGPEAGRGARLRAAFPGARVIVFGHTHWPVLDLDGDVMLLNPGSPTERRRAPHATFAELRIAGGRATARLVELP
jgi:uncharacterized protein